jgi:hypothetical protein
VSEIEQCFCTNEQCKDFGLRSQGNIAVRAKYGKDKSRDLLYCRSCGKRFAATQGSALFGLHIPAEMIQQIIHHARVKPSVDQHDTGAFPCKKQSYSPSVSNRIARGLTGADNNRNFIF